jgi:hypothetical protein
MRSQPLTGECTASPAADRPTDPVEDPRSVSIWVRTAAPGLAFILTVSLHSASTNGFSLNVPLAQASLLAAGHCQQRQRYEGCTDRSGDCDGRGGGQRQRQSESRWPNAVRRPADSFEDVRPGSTMTA